jgi:hypothetical protein
MNKYVIPICDTKDDLIYNLVISANSISDCEAKLMEKMSERYDIDPEFDFNEFIDDMGEYDVLIGEIQDIEEL